MEFLLELLTEEMPSSHVRSALGQLSDGFREGMASYRVKINDLEIMATPRRLIIRADLNERQEDTEVQVTGPPKSVGLDEAGNLTAAGKGFARAHKIPEGQLEVVITARGEYLGFKKITRGLPAETILASFVPRLLGELSFPRTMRWGNSSFRFSRPIHGLVCLFGGRCIETSFAGVNSSDETVGHRIISPARFKIESFSDYREKLRAHGVIIDQAERKQMIISQFDKYLAAINAGVYPDQELLEELVYGVEHPLVIFGSFSESFLSLPLEVLATALREGQKLFSVVREKKQLPYFLGVADAILDDDGLIKSGNERVLKARLEDARFFWLQDRKIKLRKKAKGLKYVIFQENLGTYEDKVQRVRKIAAYLCEKIGAVKIKKVVTEAAELCKADLMTEMVREFPVLQGKMGGLYARAEGYPAAVWQAIYEHYKPVSLEDDSPSSLAGAVLSLADKIDTIVGAIGLGLEVSGSSDPFGLRRNANGVCKLILDKKLRFSLVRLIDKVLNSYGHRLTLERDKVVETCLDFFKGRLRYIFEKQGFRYDLIQAALGPGIDRVYDVFLKVKALDNLRSGPQFEDFILMAKRVKNILRDQLPGKLNPEIFSEKEEKELYLTLNIVKDNAIPMIERGDMVRAQNIIIKLHPVLNNFFNNVLVMAENKKIRQNRLALLKSIDELLARIADYSQVVLESEK